MRSFAGVAGREPGAIYTLRPLPVHLAGLPVEERGKEIGRLRGFFETYVD